MKGHVDFLSATRRDPKSEFMIRHPSLNASVKIEFSLDAERDANTILNALRFLDEVDALRCKREADGSGREIVIEYNGLTYTPALKKGGA